MMHARAKKQLQDLFHQTHFVETLGGQHFFRTRTDAILHAREHLGDLAGPQMAPLLRERGELVRA
jgi:hypothetical protein